MTIAPYKPGVKKDLPFRVAVVGNGRAIRMDALWHLVIEEERREGRLYRAAGEQLCKPLIYTKGIYNDYLYDYGAGPPARPYCTRCLNVLRRFGVDV